MGRRLAWSGLASLPAAPMGGLSFPGSAGYNPPCRPYHVALHPSRFLPFSCCEERCSGQQRSGDTGLQEAIPEPEGNNQVA